MCVHLGVAELGADAGKGVLQQVAQVAALGAVLHNGAGASGEGDSQAGAFQHSRHLSRGIEE